jgi:lipopolysaccharide transport system permease protein
MDEEKKQAMKIVYTSESQMRTPGKLFLSMWRDLKDSRELAWRLFCRDFLSRYRKSLLGIFWAFLPPIATGAVFIILQAQNVVNFGKTDVPYPVYVLVGTTLWQLFTESINAPLNSVKSSKSMLAKINFPREALIVSAFYQVLLNLGIKSIIIAGVFIYFRIPPTMGLLGAFGAVFMLIALGFTIGLLITPVGALYDDIAAALPIITQLWFFLTPVVYPPPKTFPFSLIATINPVSPILNGVRDLATKGILQDSQLFITVSILTVLGLLLAWLLFRLAVTIIIERLSG